MPRLFRDHILNKTNSEIDQVSGKRLLIENEVDPFEILKEIIEVKLLNTDDYDSDSYLGNPYVVYYNVTRFTQRVIDLQILWHKPNEITLDVSRPDQMRVWFKTNSLFVDERDFQQLEKDDSKLTVDIVPQVTQAEMNELVETAQ